MRAAGVWSAATTGTAAATALASPSAARLADAGTWSVSFEGLLEPLCAVAFLGAAAWLWTLTTVTVGAVLLDRVPESVASRAGVVRRVVLVACGVAVVAGTAAPVAAAAGGDEQVLVGLRLPDRAASTSRAPSSSRLPDAAAAVHVVRPGDSLWSVAEATSPPGTDVDARWRAIWAANRDVVGDDPHLILPGQRLRLPSPDTSTDRNTDTSRGTSPDETGDRP
jgi:hypothetical protein